MLKNNSFVCRFCPCLLGSGIQWKPKERKKKVNLLRLRVLQRICCVNIGKMPKLCYNNALK